MLLECQNCGAPLDVAQGRDRVKCNYCGKETQAKQARTVAQETPPDWKPPKSWRPPPDRHLPDVSLPYRAAGKAIAKIIGLVTTVIMLVGGLVVWKVVHAFTGASDPLSKLGGGETAQLLDGFRQAMKGLEQAGQAVPSAQAMLAAASEGAALPAGAVLCAGNQTMTLTGKTLNVPGGVPVTARDNCVLKIVGSTISGATALEASGNAKVTVTGGMLTGVGPAVSLSGNAVLEAKGAALSGEGALTATGNARARLMGSTINGGRVAVNASGLAQIDAKGSVVQGQVVGKVRR